MTEIKYCDTCKHYENYKTKIENEGICKNPMQEIRVKGYDEQWVIARPCVMANCSTCVHWEGKQ